MKTFQQFESETYSRSYELNKFKEETKCKTTPIIEQIDISSITTHVSAFYNLRSEDFYISSNTLSNYQGRIDAHDLYREGLEKITDKIVIVSGYDEALAIINTLHYCEKYDQDESLVADFIKAIKKFFPLRTTHRNWKEVLPVLKETFLKRIEDQDQSLSDYSKATEFLEFLGFTKKELLPSKFGL